MRCRAPSTEGAGRCEQGLCNCTGTNETGLFCSDPISEQNECVTDGICGDHGACDNGFCRCDPGWSGGYCTVNSTCADDDECPLGINCHAGICQCARGTTGAQCEIKTGESSNVLKWVILSMWIVGSILVLVAIVLGAVGGVKKPPQWGTAASVSGGVGILLVVAGALWYQFDDSVPRF